ncbi:hypothetical protein [Chitinophaga ginsengisoli]|uniref:Uncharacterized protein n=1 Tax=Chitinophaga ginsengisoli TaxID=363837 RepID=A0A2P8FRU6_9BACT|nr:hypothetical protein [Chitinophaga ginsengisoli]PSL24423.1 hypothetical protein CLV42_1159 [Chitinophaga ginsengisoli]
MVSNDLVIKFTNTTEQPLTIVIDPPVYDFDLNPQEDLQLKIIDYRSASIDVSDIIDVRYSTPNAINIDIRYNFKLVAVFRGEEQTIWGL